MNFKQGMAAIPPVSGVLLGSPQAGYLLAEPQCRTYQPGPFLGKSSIFGYCKS